MAATPYNASFFDKQVAGSLASARIVLPLLFDYYKPRSIVDVGCGVGPWLKCSLELGVEEVLGIDGDYVDRSRLLIDRVQFRGSDLNDRIKVDRRFDLAISVEVAEHLSYVRSETFVADLVRLSDVVLFSAALPYQGGTNHINEQWLEFWAILFRRHGYVACDFLRPRIWASERVDFWYSQNLLVFCPTTQAHKIFPEDSIAADRPLSFLHPMTFLSNVARYRPYSGEASNSEFIDYAHLLRAYVAGETTLPLLKMLTANGSNPEHRVPLFPNARTEIMDARGELSIRDNKIHSLSTELAARETENATLELEAKRLMESLVAENEARSITAAELAKRITENAALELEAKRLMESLLAENEARSITAAELATRIKESTRISAERQALIRRLAASNEEVARLDAAVTAHKAEIVRLSDKLVREEGERLALRDLNERQQSVLEAELQQFHNKTKEQNRELSRKEDEVRLLTGDLADTKHALNATKASWSWKITAPLRTALDILLWIGKWPGTADQRLSQLRAYAQYLWRGSRLRTSGLFDSGYYLQHNPDIAQSGHKSNPLLHFFLFGASEGRNPHPLFDLQYYLERNPDVADSRINPLLHYLCWGAREGRDPHPHFDSSFYLERYPDVAGGGGNPLAHYMGPGTTEGMDPNPSFHTSDYLEQNPDVALKGLNPLLHHLATREIHGVETAMTAQIQPPETALRISLRASFQESGRPLPDSDYDSIPLISVIIPYFNHGRYLEDAVLCSLLACSYPMEIIVIDDGSTDSRSVEVVNELSAKYKFQLVNQINAGRSAARNAGVQRARGKFVQFLDADDLLDEHKIDIQVAEFQADPTIDICLCDYDMCNGDGQERFSPQPSKIAGFSFSREDFLLRWERGFSVAIHTALFRRELLDQVRFRQVTRAGHEDWIFWIELASQSPKFNFNPTALAAYRIHGQNTTANNEIMGLDFLRAAMYVMHTGLNTCDNFWQATTEHFRKAYLGYIKQDAITLSRTRPVD